MWVESADAEVAVSQNAAELIQKGLRDGEHIVARNHHADLALGPIDGAAEPLGLFVERWIQLAGDAAGSGLVKVELAATQLKPPPGEEAQNTARIAPTDQAPDELVGVEQDDVHQSTISAEWEKRE